MRIIPPLMEEALQGSTPDARMVFHSFYDGRLAAVDPLPADSWTLRWSARSRTIIRTEGSVTVGDEVGSLAPWGLSDALSAAGSRISAVFHCGGESLDLARMLVTDNRPDEQLMVAAGRWVMTGASVGLTMAELSLLIQDDEFIAAESPPSGTTALLEIQRLLLGRSGVLVGPGVVDRPLPPMVHPENKLEALYALIDMVGDARFTGDGQLYVYKPDTSPSFTIRGKPMGDLVGLAREQKRSNFINFVVSTGKDDAGNELKAYARITSGDLRDGGPLGRRIDRHNAIANTQAGVQQDADTRLANLQRDSTVEVPFECLPSALIGAEAGDYGQIMFPALDGNEYALPGRLMEATLSGGAGGFSPGRGVLAASTQDLERISDALAEVRRNP